MFSGEVMPRYERTKDGTETATCANGCGATDTREIADSKVEHKFTNYVSNNNIP
jgi:hypothetical protein